MESLSDIHWDVVISGTGLQQSLLALALSRSGKRVLHVDKNDYYGGPEAAFSLQEAESWVKAINAATTPWPFHNASISTQPIDNTSDTLDDPNTQLSFSRAYTLSLSPQLIYTRSDILPKLVSSKLYRQLEFQAVGSWWVYAKQKAASSSMLDTTDEQSKPRRGSLRRVPNGREDVFADKSIDLRAKRSLMKFLKFVGAYEEQRDIWEEWAEKPFPDFLKVKFGLPSELQVHLLALTLSPWSPNKTLTSLALPRIRRHLTSIGVFGPGFAAVIPKWGGGAEIAQVACRACAVGGGVYVLGRGVERIRTPDSSSPGPIEGDLSVSLQGGETVKAEWVVGSYNDLYESQPSDIRDSATRSITIVSSLLHTLFPVDAEGAPTPGGAVVVFPTGSLKPTATIKKEVAPVYIIAHSSETGECPDGQCVLYASTSTPGEDGYVLLDSAVEALLQSLDGHVLWRLRYSQCTYDGLETSSRVVVFPPPSLDLAFDDDVLRRVEDVWKKVDGEGDFMEFQDRGALGDEED